MSESWKRLKRALMGERSSGQPKQANDVAIIDAATIYGASRWYRSVHNDPTWQYATQYKAATDRLLFEEFIHELLLYDTIILDNSSVNEIGAELLELMRIINAASSDELIVARAVAPFVTIEPVANTICKLLADAIRGAKETRTSFYRRRRLGTTRQKVIMIG